MAIRRRVSVFDSLNFMQGILDHMSPNAIMGVTEGQNGPHHYWRVHFSYGVITYQVEWYDSRNPPLHPYA